MITPCPVCGAPYGFHDDEPHDAAVARIPAHLKLPTSGDVRAVRRADRAAAYAAYLARSQGVGVTLTMVPATPADLSTVTGLWSEAAAWLASRDIDQWQYPPHVDRIERSIAAGECWLATDGDIPVGTITVDQRADPEFWTDADQPDTALYAHRMVVSRKAAGAGTGGAMLEHASRLAAAAGKAWLRLDAWRDNPGLQGYYGSQGFELVRVVELPHRRSGALFQRPVDAY